MTTGCIEHAEFDETCHKCIAQNAFDRGREIGVKAGQEEAQKAQRPRCATCRWWEPQFGRRDHSEGQCRRHGPSMSMVVTTDRYRAENGRWPETRGVDWCGDFELMPTTPAPETD
jgi:hypothetical protein